MLIFDPCFRLLYPKEQKYLIKIVRNSTTSVKKIEKDLNLTWKKILKKKKIHGNSEKNALGKNVRGCILLRQFILGYTKITSFKLKLKILSL